MTELRRLLYQGQKGDDVSALQAELKINVDGVFGPGTAAACEAQLGHPWFVVATHTAEQPRLYRKKVIQAALVRMRDPMKWEAGNFIDTEVLGPFRKLIGAKEGHRFSWCAAWVHYIIRQVAPDFPLVSQLHHVFTSVANFREAAKHCNAIISAEQALTPGDIVLLDWNDDGTSDHIGIFYETADLHIQKLVTLEGNASNTEAVRIRSKGFVNTIIDTEKFLKAYA